MIFFKTRYRWTWLLVLLILTQSAIPAHALTIQEEEKLSIEFMELVRKEFEFIEDPVITDYVRRIGQKLLASQPPTPFPYHFYVIKADVYNAFAGPAGNIFVNSGLMAAMESEEELAGILAHEIAHEISRHISEKIQRASKINLATLAGIAAGILLGASGAGAAANAVTIGSMAANQSLSLAFSREDERQADSLALKYLSDAGYSARGLLRILKKIREKNWFGSDIIPAYLMTHPAAEERIASLESWLEKNPQNSSTANKESSEVFAKAHVRLVALYIHPDIAGNWFRSGLDDPAKQSPYIDYGYGLLLDRKGLRGEALKYLKSALEQRIFDPVILADLGRIYLMDGQYEDAEKALKGAVSIDPEYPIARFYLGRIQLEKKEYHQAAKTLDRLLETHPDYDPSIYYFLAEAYGRGDDPGKGHYYLGIYHYKKGDFKTAAFHLNRALKGGIIGDQKEEVKKTLQKIDREAAKAKREEEEKEPVRRPRWR